MSADHDIEYMLAQQVSDVLPPRIHGKHTQLEPIAQALVAARRSLLRCVRGRDLRFTLHQEGGHIYAGATPADRQQAAQCALAALRPFLLPESISEPVRVYLASPLASGNEPVPGALSKEALRDVIHDHLSELGGCYEKHVISLGVERRIAFKMEFGINKEGRVFYAKPLDLPDGLARFACCVRQQVAAWKFPAPSGGDIVIITWPFVAELDP